MSVKGKAARIFRALMTFAQFMPTLNFLSYVMEAGHLHPVMKSNHEKMRYSFLVRFVVIYLKSIFRRILHMTLLKATLAPRIITNKFVKT